MTQTTESRVTDAAYFVQGLLDGIPICLGYLAVSFAFGIQATSMGLSVFEATLISITNVTSAGQFAGLSVIASCGSYLEMAGVQFIINLRYMLMSAAISQKLSPKVSTGKRMLMACGMTDEIFGICISRPRELVPSYCYGATVISVAGWVLGTFLGAFSGELLPHSLSEALGVALYGMFIAIVVPVARENRAVLITAIIAMALSTLFSFAPLLSAISPGLRIILVTLITAGAAALLFPIEIKKA